MDTTYQRNSKSRSCFFMFCTRHHSQKDDTAAKIIQLQWFRHMTRRSVRLRKYIFESQECSVCGDTCVRILRCVNGHGICVGCSDSVMDLRCPVCREHRHSGETIDVTSQKALECLGTVIQCNQCGRRHVTHEHEQHRAWCPAHQFMCPISGCTHATSVANMHSHLESVHANSVHRLMAKVQSLPGRSRVLPNYECTLLLTSEPTQMIFPLEQHGVLHVSSSPLRMSCSDATYYGQYAPYVVLQLRTYYPGPHAPCLSASVKQFKSSGCTSPHKWCEEHRVDTVSPILATEEMTTSTCQNVMMCLQSAISWDDDLSQHLHPRTFPNVAPNEKNVLATIHKHARLKDACGRQGAHRQHKVAVVHLTVHQTCCEIVTTWEKVQMEQFV